MQTAVRRTGAVLAASARRAEASLPWYLILISSIATRHERIPRTTDIWSGHKGS